MMSKYLQVVWLYVIGLMVILIGVYLLINNGGPSSFVVMLVGLGVAAIGSAHGRRMRQLGQFGIEDLMREGGPEVAAGKEPAPTQSVAIQEQAASQPVAEQVKEVRPEERVVERGEPIEPKRGGILGVFRRGPAERHMGPQEIMQIEMEDIKSGKLAPTEADVIELVCPRCGAENEEKNFYCYSCGNKLRRKPTKEAKIKRPEIAVEPGAIEVVGEKMVAKVVICPRCNAANKEADKFCFNCGKKLRTERGKKGTEESNKK